MSKLYFFDKVDTKERLVTFSYQQSEFINDYGINRLANRIVDDIAKSVTEDMRDDIVAGLNIKAIQKEVTTKVGIEIARQLAEAKEDVTKFGLCPYCNQQIKGYKPPIGSFAPEAYETLRENGIDPSTGHKQNCKHKDIKL